MIRSKSQRTARSGATMLALVVCAFLTMALAQSAIAANVTSTSSTGPHTLTAAAGETNTISVTKVSTYVVQISDSTATLTESSSGCSMSGANVRCNVPISSTTTFTWNLGNMDDSITVASDVTKLRNTFDGGDGYDSISGGPLADTLAGGSGSEGDVLNCGSGIDLVTYADHAAGVTVYPDGDANDGGVDEFDNVNTNCEDITGAPSGGNSIKASDSQGGVLQGGYGADILTASTGNTSTNCAPSSVSALWGFAGNDTLVGQAGANYLGAGDGDDMSLGGSDCDYIYDEGGSDVLNGNAGDDYVNDGYDYGGAASNVIIGGPGADSVFGNNKDDLLITYDGEVDQYSCLAGNDQIVMDPGDGLGNSDGGGNCETVTAIPDPSSF